MSLPNFSFEKRLWKKGVKYVAGVDEVGRGCFAGPIVASAVVFAPRTALTLRRELRLRSQEASVRGRPVRIDDSKKLRPRQREKAGHWIRKNALAWGVGEVSVAKINRLGMAKATKMAFRKAISQARERLDNRIDYLLVDAFYIPYTRSLPIHRKRHNSCQLAIIHGDEKSISIAAASIIAKVYRDRLMQSLSRNSEYKKYGWGKNKGYGTKEHQKAIIRYGITRFHRKKFVETFLKNNTSLLEPD